MASSIPEEAAQSLKTANTLVSRSSNLCLHTSSETPVGCCAHGLLSSTHTYTAGASAEMAKGRLLLRKPTALTAACALAADQQGAPQVAGHGSH